MADETLWEDINLYGGRYIPDADHFRDASVLQNAQEVAHQVGHAAR
jgi:hypothetical protein